MPTWYGDVEVTKKERERVMITAKKKPTKKQVLEMLQNNECDDITDSESLEYISIEKMELEEQEDDGGDDDEE